MLVAYQLIGDIILYNHYWMEVRDMELAATQLIKLYMQTQVLIGNIYYAPTPEARLLDALNGLVDRGPVKKGRFLELTDVTIYHATGRKEKLKISYINKATIQLAVSLGGADSGRGIGALDGPKSYPFVPKTPLPVRIETHDYVVNGNMYRMSYQRVWHVLEDAPVFLPITHGEVHSLANDTVESYPFIAVNKEHIMSLQEENGKKKNGGINNRMVSRKKNNGTSKFVAS